MLKGQDIHVLWLESVVVNGSEGNVVSHGRNACNTR